jgi:hypothetical protein
MEGGEEAMIETGIEIEVGMILIEGMMIVMMTDMVVADVVEVDHALFADHTATGKEIVPKDTEKVVLFKLRNTYS